MEKGLGWYLEEVVVDGFERHALPLTVSAISHILQFDRELMTSCTFALVMLGRLVASLFRRFTTWLPFWEASGQILDFGPSPHLGRPTRTPRMSH